MQMSVANLNSSETTISMRAQSCPTLCDHQTPLSIFQARILERIAFPSPRDLPSPGIKSESPALAGRFFTTVPPWEIKVACVHAKSLQSCLTLCDPMDCSPPGSTVHGIFQARILELVAISYSRGCEPNLGLLHCRQILYH